MTAERDGYYARLCRSSVGDGEIIVRFAGTGYDAGGRAIRNSSRDRRIAMTRERRFRWIVSLVAMVGVLQFLVAVGFAIAYYPGGYSFFGDFLSDLGGSSTGKANPGVARLFNGSIVVLGISLVPFFALVPSTVDSAGRSSWVFGAGGAVSSMGLVGIGLTPYDVYTMAHNTALAMWLGPMFVLAVLYLELALDSRNASAGLIACTAGLILAVVFYGLIGFHLGHVAMQKVTVVLSIVWFVVLAFRVMLTNITQISTRRQQIERLANLYVKRLEQGNWRRQ